MRKSHFGFFSILFPIDSIYDIMFNGKHIMHNSNAIIM